MGLKGSGSCVTMTHEYDWLRGQQARVQTDETADVTTGTIIDVREEPTLAGDEQVRIILDTADGELDIRHERVTLA